VSEVPSPNPRATKRFSNSESSARGERGERGERGAPEAGLREESEPGEQEKARDDLPLLRCRPSSDGRCRLAPPRGVRKAAG
jgi:hypothetical protein